MRSTRQTCLRCATISRQESPWSTQDGPAAPPLRETSPVALTGPSPARDTSPFMCCHCPPPGWPDTASQADVGGWMGGWGMGGSRRTSISRAKPCQSAAPCRPQGGTCISAPLVPPCTQGSHTWRSRLFRHNMELTTAHNGEDGLSCPLGQTGFPCCANVPARMPNCLVP